MKSNNEIERSDIVVCADMDADCDTGVITAYIETWFDVDKKFGVHTAQRDDEWLNLYADYNTKTDEIKFLCQLSNEDSHKFFDYIPTNDEAKLVKEMITEKLRDVYGQTPQEFCGSPYTDKPEIGGIT